MTYADAKYTIAGSPDDCIARLREYIDAGADHDDLDTDDVHEIAQFACDDAVQRAIVDTLNAAPALIAEERALRARLAEAKRIGHEFAEMCAAHKDTAGMLAALEAL